MNIEEQLTLTSEEMDRTGFILLEDQTGNGWCGGASCFADPVDIISCTEISDVATSLESLDKALRIGLYAAGFLSYEAGNAFIPHQTHRTADGFPLLWFGLYEKVRTSRRPVMLHQVVSGDPPDVRFDVTRERFTNDLQRVLHYIREGDTYQVNYTCRALFSTSLRPWDLYALLRRSQPVPYSAFLNCGGFYVLSHSPELFLAKRGNVLTSEPMKGTAPRGSTPADDAKTANLLSQCTKNRAENLMIADLMRNDLGRIARAGTVEVFDPFLVTPYRTLHQMTTGVRAEALPEWSPSGIIRLTFPPGSITGAPKVRTMQIIRELESSPRHVYTGSVGCFGPDGDFEMNVAIRTVIMGRDGRCEMGVGSGIVADSDPSAEYRETILKTRFLTSPHDESPQLLETMLLDPDGTLPHLEAHVRRMSRSAEALGYPFDEGVLRGALADWLAGAIGPAVVRMRLDRLGEARFELLPFPESRGRGVRILLSQTVTDPLVPFLYHKTTSRHVYDVELAAARHAGFDEVWFRNNTGHLTEGAITNLFIRTSSGWITPRLSCGLLAGTWRARFLARTGASEEQVTLDILQKALEVAVGNAVRGRKTVVEIQDHTGRVLYREGSPDMEESVLQNKKPSWKQDR